LSNLGFTNEEDIEIKKEMKKEKKHTKRGTKQKTWNIYIYKKKCKANTQKKKQQQET
jgi:hypothetical protein